MKILTLNLHKGFSALNTKYILPQIRDALRAENPDIVFLQEVLGNNHGKAPAKVHQEQPSQYEYLADSIWSDFAYAKNAVYSDGDHGNAILSRFPITKYDHVNLSTYALEQRGFLYAEILIPEFGLVHCICVHLGLLSMHRKQQFKILTQHIEVNVPIGAPLILAGDMNDWSHTAQDHLATPLGLDESHCVVHGKLARTFPGPLPILRLDRIYTRCFKTLSASVLAGKPWSALSDHLPMTATIEFLKENIQ